MHIYALNELNKKIADESLDSDYADSTLFTLDLFFLSYQLSISRMFILALPSFSREKERLLLM